MKKLILLLCLILGFPLVGWAGELTGIGTGTGGITGVGTGTGDAYRIAFNARYPNVNDTGLLLYFNSFNDGIITPLTSQWNDDSGHSYTAVQTNTQVQSTIQTENGGTSGSDPNNWGGTSIPCRFWGGIDKVTNGSFTGGTTGWTLGGARWVYGTNNINCDPGTAGINLSQDIGAIAGEIYRIEFTMSNRIAGNVKLYIGSAGGNTFSEDGSYARLITCLADGDDLIFYPNAAGDYTLDDIKVFKSSEMTIDDNDALSALSPIFIEVWCRPLEVGSGTLTKRLLSKFDTNQSEWAFHIRDIIEFEIFDQDTPWFSAYGNIGTITAGKWYYFSAEWDGTVGSGIKVFQDNVNMTTGTDSSGVFTSIRNTTSKIRIGNTGATAYEFPFLGSIAIVRLWNRIPTDTEKAALYNRDSSYFGK